MRLLSLATKKRIITLGVILLFAAIVAPLTCCSLNNPQPHLWPRVGVYERKLNLVKTKFLTDTNIGLITDIKYGRYDKEFGNVVVVAGEEGAIIADTNGKILRNVIYNPGRKNIISGRILDVDKDGDNEYLLSPYYSNDGRPALLDHRGEVIWKYPFLTNEVIPCDCDDSFHGFIIHHSILRKYPDMVELLDNNGKRKWLRKYGQISDIYYICSKDNRKEQIVFRRSLKNNIASIAFMNMSGNIMKEVIPDNNVNENYFAGFGLIYLPDKYGEPHFVNRKSDYNTVIVAFDAKTVKKEFTLGYLPDYDSIETLKFMKDKPRYFAIYGRINIQQQFVGFAKVMSKLQIYDSQYKLAYKEILNEEGKALTSVSDPETGGEFLLIGEMNTVWKYSISDTTQSPPVDTSTPPTPASPPPTR